MLGVCLGHQVIAQAMGGRIVRAPGPVHGQASYITHSGAGLFAGCPNPLRVGRYHSLIADQQTLPDCLKVTSTAEDRIIMSFEHRSDPVYGVQFHPESILTTCGHQILSNFLQLAGINVPLGKIAGDIDAEEWDSVNFFSREIQGETGRPM